MISVALNFCIFFIVAFVVLVVTFLHFNGRIRNHPELRQFYKKAMDGLLVTHEEDIRRLTGGEVVREGVEIVSKDYVKKEEKKFKQFWWLSLVFSVFLVSVPILIAGSVRKEWGIETIEISSLFVLLLSAGYWVLFALSLWLPSHSATKYRHYASRRTRREPVSKYYGSVYVHAPSRRC